MGWTTPSTIDRSVWMDWWKSAAVVQQPHLWLKAPLFFIDDDDDDWWLVMMMTMMMTKLTLRTTYYRPTVLLYGSETWTLLKADERRLEAFHMNCQRRSGSASEDDPAERACSRSKTTLGSTPTTPGGSHMTASLGGRYDPWPVKPSTDWLTDYVLGLSLHFIHLIHYIVRAAYCDIGLRCRDDVGWRLGGWSVNCD